MSWFGLGAFGFVLCLFCFVLCVFCFWVWGVGVVCFGSFFCVGRYRWIASSGSRVSVVGSVLFLFLVLVLVLFFVFCFWFCFFCWVLWK